MYPQNQPTSEKLVQWEGECDYYLQRCYHAYKDFVPSKGSTEELHYGLKFNYTSCTFPGIRA